MLKKPWFLFALFIGWCWLCLQWYCCWMQVACDSCTNELRNPYAIGFHYGQSEPNLGNTYEQFALLLKNDQKATNQLEITGKYFANESKGAELAKRRAEAMAESLKSSISLDRNPIVRIQKVWERAPMADTFFQAIDIQWIAIPMEKIALEKVFYFVKRTTDLKLNIEDLAYLKSVAALALKNNVLKILIEGHADNSGRPELNTKLAGRRADFIAKKLEELGVASGQIAVENKGDSSPLFPNTTEENRSKNRRAVLKLLNTNG